MSQTTAVAERQRKLHKMLTDGQQIILRQSSVLMSYGIKPDVFANGAYNALMTNPALADCFPDQFFKALRHSIRDGIVPDGREGVIVPIAMKNPENGKWFAGKPGCAYYPMREGLARAFVSATKCRLKFGAVRENDQHKLTLGLEPKLEHEPALGQDRGDLLFAWCWHRMPDGDEDMSIMEKDEVDMAMSKSRAKDGPWKDWYERMAIKSVIKRHANAYRHLIPKDQSERFASILDDDEEHAEVTVIEEADQEFVPVEGEIAPEARAPETIDQQADEAQAAQTAEAPKEEPKPKRTRQRKKAPPKQQAAPAEAKQPDPPPEAQGEGAKPPSLPGFDDDFGGI